MTRQEGEVMMGRSVYLSVRRPVLLAMPHQGARDAIAALAPGGAVCGLTKGQFSLIDLVCAALQVTGPADVRLSTWSTGIRDAESARALLDSGSMTRLRLYTDRSFPTRQPQYAARLVALFGSGAIRCTDIHAKIAIIIGGGRHVVIRSSMNLNRNPRFEQFDIDDSPGMASFFGAWLDELDAMAPGGVTFKHAESRRAFESALRAGVTDDAAIAAMVGADPPPAPSDLDRLLAACAADLRGL